MCILNSLSPCLNGRVALRLSIVLVSSFWRISSLAADLFSSEQLVNVLLPFQETSIEHFTLFLIWLFFQKSHKMLNVTFNITCVLKHESSSTLHPSAVIDFLRIENSTRVAKKLFWAFSIPLLLSLYWNLFFFIPGRAEVYLKGALPTFKTVIGSSGSMIF